MPPAKKKGISISLVGTEVPVYFPDDSAVKLKITPNTTAGAAIQAIRAQVRITTTNPAYIHRGNCCIHVEVSRVDAAELVGCRFAWRADTSY